MIILMWNKPRAKIKLVTSQPIDSDFYIYQTMHHAISVF